MAWVANNDQSLSLIENQYFQNMLTELRPSLCLPKSGDTIGNWLDVNVATYHEEVKRTLHDSISRICLSMDDWTPPTTHMAYLRWLLMISPPTVI